MKYIEDCGHIVQGYITATATARVTLSCDSGPDDTSGNRTIAEHGDRNTERLEAALAGFLAASHQYSGFSWKRVAKLDLLNDGELSVDSALGDWEASEEHEPYSDDAVGAHTTIERSIEIEYRLVDVDADDFTAVGVDTGAITVPCRRLIGEAMDEDINSLAEWLSDGLAEHVEPFAGFAAGLVEPYATDYRFTSYDERDQTSTSNLKELKYRYEVHPYLSVEASAFNV